MAEVQMHKYTCMSAIEKVVCDEDETVIEIKQCDPEIFFIRKRAFAGLNHVQKIIIPDTLFLIECEAFIGCSNLTCVTCEHSDTSDVSVLPGYLQGVQARAFAGTKLNKVKFLTSKELELGEEVFADCPNLQTVSFDTQKVLLEKDAFRNCTSLEYFLAPYAEVKIPDQTFSGCNNLKCVLTQNGGSSNE